MNNQECRMHHGRWQTRSVLECGGSPLLQGSGKVAVNLLAVEAADKGDGALFEDQAHPIITDADAVVFAPGVQPLEVGYLLESAGGFYLFNHPLDAAPQSGVGQGGKVPVKGFAKARVHAARSSRWKIFRRLISGDFSPSWMARMRATSSRLSRTASRSKSRCSSRTSATALLSRPFRRRSSTAIMEAGYASRSGKSKESGHLSRLFFFIILHSAVCLSAWGQYSIDWSTIDGGGSTSTGGVYSVSGTIGQPDAGTMSGGIYTLSGGFWGIVAAVQTPGAPLLSITLNSQLSTITVSWPLPANGWVLEATNALPVVAAPWPQIAPPYQTNGANLQFTEPSPAGNKFYRLHKP